MYNVNFMCVSIFMKLAKNASTGSNKFNIKYHYAPEMLIEPTVFPEKHGRDSWS